MTDRRPFLRRRFVPLAVSLFALMAATPVLAEESAPSTLSLLEAMVAKGVITQEQADAIVADAKARDAAKAAAAPQAAQPAKSEAAAAPQQGGATSSKTADGAVHVQYVPQAVKDQIKTEVKQEVLAQAKDEGWAEPNQIPDWVNRIQVSGDVRLRSEEDMFPRGNTIGTGSQVNVAALQGHNYQYSCASSTNGVCNAAALSTAANNTVPFYNWDHERERERLRARLAVDADVGEGFTTEVRLATGSDSQPVSTNQTLGASGGDFSKYQMWLDRAFIRYEPVNTDTYGLSATVGRFANPFFSTDLIWWSDLNFDGVAASGRYQVAKGVTPWLTFGAFPVYDTDLNFSTDDENKTPSHDKWLFAGQAGTDWKPARDTAVRVGAAYYYFDNIEGKSVDCLNNDDPSCGSQYAPSFAQHGNTYFAIRNNPNSWASNNFSGTADGNNYQYFGLATPFHELALTGRIDYDGLRPIFPGQAFRLTFDGEFVKNLAFNKANIQNKVCSSAGECWNNDENGRFAGGDTGAMLRATVGTPALVKRWDWNASIAYKYIESDAVVDAFNDPDFGLGGTNLKGFVLAGNLALAKNVWTDLRWFSADSIAGSTYASDVVYLDINAKF